MQSVESKIEDLRLDIKDYNVKIGKVDKRLEAIKAERELLENFRSAANRLRGEFEGKTGAPAPAENEDASGDDSDAAGARNWQANQSLLNINKSTAPQSSQAPPRRTREEIDADLRANGLELEVDGNTLQVRGLDPQRRFQNLEQLEAWISEKTKYLNEHESIASDERKHAQEAADSAAETQQEYERKLREMELDNQQSAERRAEIEQDIRTAEQTRELIDDLGVNDLFEAIAEELTSPSQPSTPATTDTTTSRSTLPSDTAGQLLQGVTSDLMSDPEYEREVVQSGPGQDGPIIDDATRREAASISQQVAAAQQAMAEAERRHQQLLQQNAQAQQIQRAWAEQQRTTQHWNQLMQQQQQMQQFGQALQQAIGNSRGSQSYGSSTSRSSGNYGNSASGNRKGGNARGFEDLFRPVTDPNRARQYQNTFGNKNRR
jgi:hypothetical protein